MIYQQCFGKLSRIYDSKLFKYDRYLKTSSSDLYNYFTDMKDIKYLPLSNLVIHENNFDQIASLISSAFSTNNPHSWGKALNLPPDGMNYYMNSYIPKVVSTSVVAIDGKQYVGAALSELKTLVNDELVSDEDSNEAYAALDAIMHAGTRLLHHQLAVRGYDISMASPYGYLAFLATDASYRNQGIAEQLVRYSSDLLSEKNAEFICSYTVSPMVSRVFERCGYENLGMIRYNTFEFNGKYPFNSLTDGMSILLKPLRLK